MKITDVRINKVNGGDTLRAFASITIDDEFVVKGLRVVEGKYGNFVSYPSTYNEKDKKYYDDAFPVTKETRDYIETIVLDAYEADTTKEPAKGKKRR